MAQKVAYKEENNQKGGRSNPPQVKKSGPAYGGKTGGNTSKKAPSKA